MASVLMCECCFSALFFFYVGVYVTLGKKAAYDVSNF